MVWATLGLAIIAALLIWQVGLAHSQGKDRQSEINRLRSEFGSWDLYISAWREVIGVSPAHDEIILGSVHAPRRYSAAQLVRVDVVRDGEAVTVTDRGSQIRGAAIGGALFGGVGAIIGGLSGEQRTTPTIHKLALMITVDDHQQPVHEVAFFSLGSNLTADLRSAALQLILREMDRYLALLRLVLRHGERAGTSA